MENSNMKNIIILKDLPSNIIEEAIVFVKANVDLKKQELSDKKRENVKVGAKAKVGGKEYIIREAESVVSNYISNMEKPKQLEITNRKLKEKYKRIKGLSIFLGIVSAFSIVINFI